MVAYENCFQTTGEHENQVSEDGENNLVTYKTNCKKNPGHPEFIPIELFSLKHLPEGHQDSDLYEFIKAVADLTVRLNVTMTSPNRPEFWPNSKRPYFLSDLRGKKTLRTGSGMVRFVRKYTDGTKCSWYRSCPCCKCKYSDKPSKVWWEIVVNTAAHVVLDDVEASQTTVRLFYDGEDSPQVIIKDNARVTFVNIEQDRCWFSCMTCDEKLANKLEKVLQYYDDVWRKVTNKYNTFKDIHKLSFIVSHPHGCSKQVSVGHWKDKIQVSKYEYNHTFTYTTCTCPGSSGASIHCVGYSWFNDHVHSGRLRGGLNYSGVGSVL